ncbi:hypothetical protein BU15DRAFT_69608 [Melanogaster broomeanus]|nr:hypothetical protein BU15DRAFT_69608 [Melanogaster broomeanus]
MTGSSPTTGGATPDGSSAPPGHLIAPPSVNDPDQPGEPIVDDGRPRFEPMSTHGVLRYENHRKGGRGVIRTPIETDYTISAMSHEYPETQDSLPDGWTAHRHPEGALYFMHSDSKTFTEVNICNKVICGDVEYFVDFLFRELRVEINNRNLSGSLNIDEVQLVVEPQADHQVLVCRYYFVNPKSRSLFWLNDWEGNEIFSDCRGVCSLPHKGLGIQSHYCRRKHWALFPNLCNITEGLKNDITDMILHATCDRLTSNRSSCSLNVEDLKHYLSLIDKISCKADCVLIRPQETQLQSIQVA